MMRVEFASGKFILSLKSEFIICVWLGSHPIKTSLRASAKAETSGFKMPGIPVRPRGIPQREH